MAERYRNLDMLHQDFRPLADRLLAKCAGAKIAVLVVETWRSQAAHEEDVANGRSWVAKSRHQNTVSGRAVGAGGLVAVDIPASLAIDLAPYDQYQLHGPDKLQWDADDPAWQIMGALGEGIGLKWGGRWEVKDMAHFQAPWA